MNRLAPVAGPVLIFFGLVKVILGLLVSVGLFYLLIKLAGLVDAMTKLKRAGLQSAASQPQTASTAS